MHFIRNRVNVMKYSYEYKKNTILIINNKIDWFFEFEMLETIYDKEILHWKKSKSIYSFWFCYVQNDFTKSINSNQFLEIFVQKAFAIVFVRKCYSYEINVENSNCLLFKIAISWLKISNEIVLSSTKNIISNWFFYCN